MRLLAMASLACMWALVKAASGRGVPVLEVAFFRQAFALVPVSLWIWRAGGVSLLTTRRPLGHLLRSAVGLAGLICGFVAVAALPLTEATAIGFASPLFMTVLSALLLRETVGRHRWAAVAVGFVGVLIMCRPDPARLPLIGTLFALGNALGAAGAQICIRQITDTERGPTIVFYFTLSGTIFGALCLPFVWVTPDPHTFALLAAAGLVGGVTQLLLTAALRLAPVSVVAPVDYSQLLWASLLGFLFWGELPTALTLVGAAIVAASGLYIVFRETRLARRPPEPPLVAAEEL